MRVKRDRHMVMDLDLLPTTHIHSRNSSLSSTDTHASTALAAAVGAHRRRSSASQITANVSQGLYVATPSGTRRSPLAPLDPHLLESSNKDFDMAHNDGYQSGRKSSTTLTHITRPTHYGQRSQSRKHLPGQQRRTSLPALHTVQEPPPPLPPLPPLKPIVPYEHEAPQDDDTDIYSRLSTFTFGDAQSPTLKSSTSTSTSLTAATSDDPEGISPLDKTPRPSVANAFSHKLKGKHSAANGWSSPSEDEEDLRRTNTRSKMRAIDDGTRRPSLPTNDAMQQYQGSSSGLFTDKGKVKSQTGGEMEGKRENGKQGGSPTSPSTPSENGLDLDTDVDLMSADDTDKRKDGYHGMSDRSSIHLNSDVGSVFGEVDDRHQDSGPIGDDEPMDEDDDENENDTQRKDSARTWTESSGRRGSLPMDIPYPAANSSVRSAQAYTHSQHSYRDESAFDAYARAHAQFRRPSRSVDDDLQRAALHLQRKASRVSVAASAVGSGHSHGLDSAGSGPSSEPDMRGVAMAQAFAQAHLDAQAEGSVGLDLGGSSNEPYQGLDLNYILSVSGGQFGGSGGLGEPRGSDSWSGRLSVGSSVVAARDPSWAAGWGISQAVGRRQSTATVNDDTFLRFVKKHDYTYDERKREWTFFIEGNPGHITSQEIRRDREIWRCLWVGRYKVERVGARSTDPNRHSQYRLNIRNIPDSHLKSGINDGPLTFIHKHSRAHAYSIFRGYRLPQQNLKTSGSILLAPKKVQEQFTSTRTTSKLSTHGLLEDRASGSRGSGSPKREQTASASGTNSATTSSTSIDGSTKVGANSSASTSTIGSTAVNGTEQQGTGKLRLKIDNKEKEKTSEPPSVVDRKGKGVARSPVESNPISSWISKNGSASSSPDKERGSNEADIPHSHVQRPPFQPPHWPTDGDDDRGVGPSRRPASSLAETESIFSEGSQQFSSALSAFDQSSIGSSQRQVRRPPPPSDLRHQIVRLPIEARGSVGSLEEQPIRTSHAEAFATLEPPFIEYLRTHSANYDSAPEHDSQPSRFKGLRKLFHPQPPKNTPKPSPQNSRMHVEVLESHHYTPPWMTMAARSKQEEQERVIRNLNDSFRDVGLLPSFKPNKNRQNKKGKSTSENVFDPIPDDSLYMLLPMWPGETDAISEKCFMDLDLDESNFPLHERQYLLIYYVPNELSKDKKPDDKKRTRGSQTSSAASHASESAATRDGRSRETATLSSFNVLARLVSYQDVNGSGIRIPTTGLAVSGPLYDAIAAIPQIRFQVDDLPLIIAFCANRERGVEVVPEGAEKLGLCLPRTNPDPDSDAPLSPLGRAALEMAWLGALAILGFSNVGISG